MSKGSKRHLYSPKTKAEEIRELKEQLSQALEIIQKQQKQIERLQQIVEQQQKEIEDLKRIGKRQAAPFAGSTKLRELVREVDSLDLASERERIRYMVNSHLGETTGQWGIKVTKFELLDIAVDNSNR